MRRPLGSLTRTGALGPARKPKRLTRAQREALAPAPPDEALAVYAAIVRRMSGRIERRVIAWVLSQLPVLGSGDALDVVALAAGIARFEADAKAAVRGLERSTRAAAKRASANARKEVARSLGRPVPDSSLDGARIEQWVLQTNERLTRMVEAQAQALRDVIANPPEGASLRKKLQDSLWISRVRGQYAARRLVYGLQAEIVKGWAEASGSRSFVWVTRRDERVRPGHGRLDGKTFLWSDPPDTGGREGRNLPGQAPNCRCRALPV